MKAGHPQGSLAGALLLFVVALLAQVLFFLHIRAIVGQIVSANFTSVENTEKDIRHSEMTKGVLCGRFYCIRALF